MNNVMVGTSWPVDAFGPTCGGLGICRVDRLLRSHGRRDLHQQIELDVTEVGRLPLGRRRRPKIGL